MNLSKALADSLDDAVVLNVVRVVGLELSSDAGEGTLQGLLGRSVNHLGLDASIIGGPGNECNLVADTVSRGEAVLEVVDGVAGAFADSTLLKWLALTTTGPKVRGETNSTGLGGGVDKLLAELLPVLVIRSLLDDDLLVVVAELVDDVLVLLAELQVVVGSDALLGNGRSIKSNKVSRMRISG